MRGQAFEVFRLLIAAVVAGAILMVLLGMIGGLIAPTTDPHTATAQLVKRFSKFGGTQSTDVIEFRKGMAIDLRAIAREAYMNEKCVNAGEIVAGFEVRDGVIEYTGVGTRARIRVKCTQGNSQNCPIACTVSIESP